MESYDRLIEGHKNFRNGYFEESYDDYRNWATKHQKPEVMVVACSDSRVNPAILTNSNLGDIFVASNVANIVPPYKESSSADYSTGSAIEYAVKHLKVKHIIVMGHSFCGGVKAMFNMDEQSDKTAEEYSLINPWVDTISEVKSDINKEMEDAPLEDKLRECERRSILVSIKNLNSFPFVKEAVEKEGLQLHAWYFDIETADLFEHNEDSGQFEVVA